LQIGWRRLCLRRAVPVIERFDRGDRRVDPDRGDDRQLNVDINGFLMVEGNLRALSTS
jgi:hypothetical protein